MTICGEGGDFAKKMDLPCLTTDSEDTMLQIKWRMHNLLIRFPKVSGWLCWKQVTDYSSISQSMGQDPSLCHNPRWWDCEANKLVAEKSLKEKVLRSNGKWNRTSHACIMYIHEWNTEGAKGNAIPVWWTQIPTNMQELNSTLEAYMIVLHPKGGNKAINVYLLMSPPLKVAWQQ